MYNNSKKHGHNPKRLASTLAVTMLFSITQLGVAPLVYAAALPPDAAPGKLAPCSSTNLAAATTISLGKSQIQQLPMAVSRIVVGGLGSARAGKPADVPTNNPVAPQQQNLNQSAAKNNNNGVADVDVMLLSPKELYLLGKRVGSMNIILQDRAGNCTIMDVAVTMDAASLRGKINEIMPNEKNVHISAAEDSLILSGEVQDPVTIERIMTLAGAYVPDKRVINMMRTSALSQVMLEVKVAEVSKHLLDQLGARVGSNSGSTGWVYSILSEFLTPGKGLIQALKLGKTSIEINGQRDDGIVRILAEPNIMAISGQQASFLSGGKIFIPVSQSSSAGLGNTITLEEKEFGVGVKFLPTVLEAGRINLRVASEVSELSQTGSPFTSVGGATAVLPSMTTRRADTTVQLYDGQSLAIAGLIKNNSASTIKRFPVIGETPILGALFRSTEFQNDMTELLFIITPRLVKPLPAAYPLPTDTFVDPGRAELMLFGKMEGSPPSTQSNKNPNTSASTLGPQSAAPAKPASSPAAQAATLPPTAPATPTAPPTPIASVPPTPAVQPAPLVRGSTAAPSEAESSPPLVTPLPDVKPISSLELPPTVEWTPSTSTNSGRQVTVARRTGTEQ